MNEEKQIKKINIFKLLIILAILVVILTCYILYCLYEKNIQKTQIDNLYTELNNYKNQINYLNSELENYQTQVNNLNSKLDNYQFQIDNLNTSSETTQENSYSETVLEVLGLLYSVMNNTNINSCQIDKTTLQCKSVFQNYLNIMAAFSTSPEDILEELNLLSYEEFMKIQGSPYKKLPIKYNDFKNQILQYSTLELFEKEFENVVFGNDKVLKNTDEYLEILNYGVSGKNYILKDMILISNTETTYTYEATIISTQFMTFNESTNTVTFEIINGEFKVSEIGEFENLYKLH